MELCFAYKCFTNGTYSLVNSYNDITENLVYITPQNSNFAILQKT
jgi:hypothetical protein